MSTNPPSKPQGVTAVLCLTDEALGWTTRNDHKSRSRDLFPAGSGSPGVEWCWLAGKGGQGKCWGGYHEVQPVMAGWTETPEGIH